MEVVTVETSTKPEHTKYLVESWKRFNVQGSILGYGVEWKGFKTKLILMKDFLNSTTSDMVLFTDSRDVVFAATAEDIRTEFISMGSRILFGAETNLYPNKKLIHGDPTKKYRYLNSGTYIGYTSDLLKLFSDVENVVDDQEYFQSKLIDGTWGIDLDYDCRIFQNLWDEEGGRSCNFDIMYQRNYIKNILTNTYPKIFHAPGPTTVLTQAYKVITKQY